MTVQKSPETYWRHHVSPLNAPNSYSSFQSQLLAFHLILRRPVTRSGCRSIGKGKWSRETGGCHIIKGTYHSVQNPQTSRFCTFTHTHPATPIFTHTYAQARTSYQLFDFEWLGWEKSHNFFFVIIWSNCYLHDTQDHVTRSICSLTPQNKIFPTMAYQEEKKGQRERERERERVSLSLSSTNK